MTNDRPFRIASLLKEEIAIELARHLDNSKFSLVTVTAVEVNPKLTTAEVFVHANKKNGELIKAIEKSKHHWIKNLQKRLTMRHVPQLNFKIDHSVDYVSHIESLLCKIKQK